MKHPDGLHEINLQNLAGTKPDAITGVASVIDGDTIEVHGQRIRFNGIDTPESRQSLITTRRPRIADATKRDR